MESRQCWAHHQDGHRCQKKATHRGDHAWSVTWTEDECAGQPLVKILVDEQPVHVPIDQPVPLLPKPKCIACNHNHNGECRCGCREYIG